MEVGNFRVGNQVKSNDSGIIFLVLNEPVSIVSDQQDEEPVRFV